jgi:hypothetical protein
MSVTRQNPGVPATVVGSLHGRAALQTATDHRRNRACILREPQRTDGMDRRRSIWCAVLCGTLACPAAAQELKPVAVGPVTRSGSIRIRAESWDWLGNTPEGEYVFSGNRPARGFADP